MTLDLKDLGVKKPKEFGFDYRDPASYQELLRLHHGRTVLEQKFDGYGCIIDNRKLPRVFSLNKNEWNIEVFPEIREQLSQAKPFLAIGELVGKPTRPDFTNIDEFAAVKRRVLKKYDPETVRALRRKFPLDLQIYHLLELNGKDLRKDDLLTMRRALESVVTGLENIYAVQQEIVDDPLQYQEIVLARFEAGLEGSIAKDPTSAYDEKRNEKWIKLKGKTAVDVVILGAYITEAQRKNGFACSGLLGGVRNGQRYETLVKIPVQDRHTAAKIMKQLDLREIKDSKELENQPKVHYNPEIYRNKNKIPQWITRNPDLSIVVEIEALEISRSQNWHSCGLKGEAAYSVRQPKYRQIREDKTPKTATTTQEIKDMYKRKG